LRNTLFVTSIFFGNALGGLDVVGFSFHIHLLTFC